MFVTKKKYNELKCLLEENMKTTAESIKNLDDLHKVHHDFLSMHKDIKKAIEKMVQSMINKLDEVL